MTFELVLVTFEVPVFSLNWQLQFLDQICPEMVAIFQSETDEIDTIEFCIFKLVFVSNFTLNKQFWIFGPKFAQDRYLWSKIEKVNIIIIEFLIFKLVLVPNFSLNWEFWFWFFLTSFAQKGFSGVKQKKWTPYIFYIILPIQVSLVRNFSSNWQFDFLDQIFPKRHFQMKTEKVNITMEFCIFELV